MKAAFVSSGPKVRVEDVPIPKPNDDQVLIQVVVSGSNPKDWKVPFWMNDENHQGDDIAGIVHEVGANVTEFKPGDRVAAFHQMRTPHGSYAEYAIAWQHTTFHIPKKTSFEEAAAIPLAAMTAALALYHKLGLPQPWHPATEPTPLVIYGAATAVGSYAVQLAVRSNIHPLICVAGRSAPHVEALIDRSKGDTIVDYRGGDDAVVAGIRQAGAALPSGARLLHALDAVSEDNTYVNLAKALDDSQNQGSPRPKITIVLPTRPEDRARVPAHVDLSTTVVGAAHGDIPAHVDLSTTVVDATHDDTPAYDTGDSLAGEASAGRDFAFVYFRYFARGLSEGWFKAQPQVVVPGGLGGVQKALEDLKAGRANAVKYVFRIAETEGLGA
ncbi:hypothetical protein SLS62_009396 [Diatrype stigma]|uniref:Enoyl reductase (ER) domain-containing protein n=1 Tax=Diatrype stigma TaxID=117547 RepID=A0AAN9UF81_9PEZI